MSRVLIVLFGSLATMSSSCADCGGPSGKVRSTQVTTECVRTALTLYRAKTGSLPDTKQGLQALVDAKYLDRLPLDSWGNGFAYEVSADGSRYRVVSFGADGRPGGEGQAADLALIVTMD